MKNKLKNHFSLKDWNESGQGMSEYLILVMLIAVASIAATRSVGKTVHGKMEQIKESVQGVTIESVRGE
jgi:Flp pilus assembly pilin Flp